MHCICWGFIACEGLTSHVHGDIYGLVFSFLFSILAGVGWDEWHASPPPPLFFGEWIKNTVNRRTVGKHSLLSGISKNASNVLRTVPPRVPELSLFSIHATPIFHIHSFLPQQRVVMLLSANTNRSHRFCMDLWQGFHRICWSLKTQFFSLCRCDLPSWKWMRCESKLFPYVMSH